MAGRTGRRRRNDSDAATGIVQFHHQRAEHLAAGLPDLPAGKAPGDPSQQVRQQRGPGIIGYRGLGVSHKPIMIAAAAPTWSLI
jgi:hypothetical protein